MPDPLSRGTVRFKQHGVAVELAVAHGLFSAAAVDPGTKLLLRWLAARGRGVGGRVLDVGCGYGPLAVWLAAAGAAGVDAVDRDAVAVEWTARNAAANGVADRVTTGASVGYDDVRGGPYDLIVSNIPAKVGPAALDHLLLDGGSHLAPDGVVSIVVVSRLADAVRATLEAAPAAEILDAHDNRSYLQVTYALEPGSGDASPGLVRGVYDRARTTFDAAGLRWTAATVRTLVEFDTLGHGTEAVVELLAADPSPGAAAVIGVGQGHVPVALALLGSPRIALVDRDLLALRVASANVTATGSGAAVAASHVARPALPPGTDVAVVSLDEKEPVAVSAAVVAPALEHLEPDAAVVLHGRAADVSRVTELLGRHGIRLAEVGRRRRGGHVAVRLRLRSR